MSKKVILIIAFVFLIFILSMLLYAIQFRIKDKSTSIRISEYSLSDSKGNIQIISDTTKEILLLFYKSDCPFCYDEIKLITENISMFKTTSVLFISDEPLQSVSDIEQIFGSEAVSFLQDKNSKLKRSMHIKNYPTLYILSPKGVFLKKKVGLASLEFIVSALQNE